MEVFSTEFFRFISLMLVPVLLVWLLYWFKNKDEKK